jgi:hypothetical protein
MTFDARPRLSNSVLIFAIYFCTSLAPLLIFFICSSDFAWYGNPDQDLVFLRDGYRLFAGEPPLYTDHPGALQIIAVSFATHILSSTRLASTIHLAYPSDSQWQLIFVLSKFLNLVAYCFLIAFICFRLQMWIGRSRAICFCFWISASTAMATEVVQLRNEAYSALLCYAAFVQIICLRNWRCFFDKPVILVSLRTLNCLAPIMFLSLALLAKSQALILIFLFDLCQYLFFIRCNQGFINSIAVSWIKHAFAFAFFFSAFAGPAVIASGVDLSSLSTSFFGFFVSGFLIGLALFSPSLFTRIPSHLQRNTLLVSCLFVFVLIILILYFKLPWLSPAFDPFYGLSYLSSTDANSSQCMSLACKFHLGLQGLVFLFKRLFMGHVLSRAALCVCAILFLMSLSDSRFLLYRGRLLGLGLLFSAFFTTAFASEFGLSGRVIVFSLSFLPVVFLAFEASDQHPEFSRCDLISGMLALSSFFSASVCSQRWTIDHYLVFQVPLLSLSLLFLTLSNSLAKKRIAMTLVAVSVISVVVITAGFVNAYPDTFQSSNLDVLRLSICRSQHSGSEWDNSSIYNPNC